ncbi:hypothetical protein KIPB_000430 [Kipferlia bialata]|uniref:Uncharacterized protein n=1 Tax=Kipferlia bialata TaxID=797122 RepID=A0A391NNL8_9EUKA|nr:hypothetical protein KIPB_000430 [Kipferlia bialata]|eukprot:g430.t1
MYQVRLHGNSIGDKGFLALARAISSHKALTRVYISPMNMTDGAAKAFVQSLGESVEKVCLFGSGINTVLIRLMNEAVSTLMVSRRTAVDGVAADSDHTPGTETVEREGVVGQATIDTSPASLALDATLARAAFRQGMYGMSSLFGRLSVSVARGRDVVLKRPRESAVRDVSSEALEVTCHSSRSHALKRLASPAKRRPLMSRTCLLTEVDPFDGGVNDPFEGGEDPFQEIDEIKYVWCPSRHCVGSGDPFEEMDPFLGDGDPFREDDPFEEVDTAHLGIHDPYYGSTQRIPTLDWDEVDPFLGDATPLGTELDPFADGYGTVAEPECLDISDDDVHITESVGQDTGVKGPHSERVHAVEGTTLAPVDASQTLDGIGETMDGETEVDILRSLLATKDTEAVALRSQLSTSTQEVASLHAQVASLHAKMTSLQQSHTATLETSHQQYLQMQQLYLMQGKSTTQERQRVMGLTEKCRSQQTEIDSLRSQVAVETKRSASLQSDLQGRDLQISSL